MCLVSYVTSPSVLQQMPPINQWSFPVVQDFREVIKRLDAIDKKLGLTDCDEPQKADIFKQINDRLAELERRVPK